MYEDKADFPALVFPMGIGSIIGAFIGASLVAVVPGQALKLLLGLPDEQMQDLIDGLCQALKLLLGLLLILSAVKIFFEKNSKDFAP